MFNPNPNMVSQSASKLVSRYGFDDAALWANTKAWDEHNHHNENGFLFWKAVHETILLRRGR